MCEGLDYERASQPIGIEITAPQQISLETISHILAKLKLSPLEEEFAPLLAA